MSDVSTRISLVIYVLFETFALPATKREEEENVSGELKSASQFI